MGNAEKTRRRCSGLSPADVFSAPSSEAHRREESLRAPGRHKQLKVGLASPLGQIAMAKLFSTLPVHSRQMCTWSASWWKPWDI